MVLSIKRQANRRDRRTARAAVRDPATREADRAADHCVECDADLATSPVGECPWCDRFHCRDCGYFAHRYTERAA